MTESKATPSGTAGKYRIERLSTDLIFEVYDLPVAAYLLTRGLRLWAVKRNDPYCVKILLTPQPRTEDLDAWLEGSVVIDSDSYKTSLQFLQDALEDPTVIEYGHAFRKTVNSTAR